MGQKVTPLRVVVDTNVLISGLLFGGEPGKIRELWIAGRLVPLLSSETFAEFTKVLSYPKFRLSPAEITMLIEEDDQITAALACMLAPSAARHGTPF